MNDPKHARPKTQKLGRPPKVGRGVTVKDRSLGIIPFLKRGEDYAVLLVKQRRAKYWAFPKGHAEEGETDEDAARRELKEETGVERCILVPNVQLHSRFRYPREGVVVHKTVVYFVGLIPSGTGGKESTLEKSTEISRAIWLPYKEALEKVTHRQSRELLERAYANLTKPIAQSIAKTNPSRKHGGASYQRKRYGL